MTNDKLPEEITVQIDKEAGERTNAEDERIQKRSIDYGRRISHLSGYEIGYTAGATAWAPWKVRHDELQAHVQRIADALEELVVLKHMKDEGLKMKEYLDRKPAAWTNAIIAIQQFKDGKGKEVTDPCPSCGKELFRDRNLCCRECGKEVDAAWLLNLPEDNEPKGMPLSPTEPFNK